MSLKPFTSNFEDNSTDAGFQFTFFCDLCGDGYKTEFIASKTYKKGGFIKGLTEGISIGAHLLGQYNLGWGAERAGHLYSEKFEGMSPEWHKEHEGAFEIAQNEAKEHFHRCPKCRKYVCDDDWNEEGGLCVECSPRLNVEINAARAEKMVKDIKDKADQTQVFKGDIDTKTTICPECGKPSGQGKFCNNCGANLSMVKCPKCGAKSALGTRFCGECGNRL